MWLWAFFLVVVVIEVWYAFAFVYAYVQLRERMLLLPALQALLMLGVFGYLAYSLNSGQPASLLVVMPLLLGVLAISIYWRRSLLAWRSLRKAIRGVRWMSCRSASQPRI